MTSTYLYQSSAVKNSMHVHIYLIKTRSNFQISERGRDLIFSHHIKKSKISNLLKKKRQNYQNHTH